MNVRFESWLNNIPKQLSSCTVDEYWASFRMLEEEDVSRANTKLCVMLLNQLDTIDIYRRIINEHAGTTWTKHANEEIEFKAASWLEDGIL